MEVADNREIHTHLWTLLLRPSFDAHGKDLSHGRKPAKTSLMRQVQKGVFTTVGRTGSPAETLLSHGQKP